MHGRTIGSFRNTCALGFKGGHTIVSLRAVCNASLRQNEAGEEILRRRTSVARFVRALFVW